MGIARRTANAVTMVAVGAIVCPLIPGTALGADIATATLNNGLTLSSVIGDLNPGDDLRFAAAVGKVEHAVIFFKSGGGSLSTGIAIGELIRRRNFDTAVSFDNICASACALAWLGGVNRSIFPRAKVGFHSAFTMKDSGVTSEASSGNALIGAYLDRLGVSYAAISALTEADPDNMHWLTANDAAGLNLSIDIKDQGKILMANKTLISVSIIASALAAPSAFSAEPLSRAAQQGYDNGFHECARAIDRVVKFIHPDDGAYAYLGSWSTNDPNNSMFTTVTSKPTKDGNVITSISGIKDSKRKCEVNYTHVYYSTDSCIKVRELDLKDWKYYGDISGSVILDDPTSSNQSAVLTTQPGNSCLIVQRFISFDLDP